MNQKILPLSNDRHPIHYDPGTDQLLELLCPYPELYERESAEHFIDTVIYDNEVSDNVSFYRLFDAIRQDCLLWFSMPYEVARATIGDICSYIVKLLDQGYYVSFVADTFYCKNYVTYQKEHAEHAPILYGYDLQEQMFFAWDYFDFRIRTRQKVAFGDIQASYKNGMFRSFPGEHVMLNVNVLCCEKIGNHTAKPICLPIIRQKLENFLSSHPYSSSDGLYYGISFFDILIKRYQGNPLRVSLKHCHFIVAHMQFMLQRIGVLQKAQPHNMQKYEAVAEQLKVLLADVQRTEMRILKAQMTTGILGMDYGERLGTFKQRYAEIVGAIVEIMG
nr:hypothetical protein [uncultured Acetatifactor sp.]